MVGYPEEIARTFASDWRPGVELAALALVTCALFAFVRRARCAPAPLFAFVLGAAALAAILAAATALGLDRLARAAAALLALAAVAFPVVFQPEIRLALSGVGRRLTGLAAPAGSPVVSAVVEAARALARSGTGAVVAIERESSLAKYARGGTRMEAMVSGDLLQSVFAKDAALKDGAAIVRRGRVAAAGCLLPLSENADLAKSLGARHRAALGLSERTDAVAVVVSGADGAISLAVNGAISRGLTVDDLRRKLEELCPAAETASAAEPWPPA
jgi:diadenylate cyclase